MYKITIVTQYNVIQLEREDINTPEMEEILAQPYILDVEMHEIDTKKLVKSQKEEKRKGRY